MMDEKENIEEKPKSRKGLIIFVILVCIGALFAHSYSTRNDIDVSEDLAKCIGENGVLYSRSNCPHCLKQEGMFQDMIKHIRGVDCSVAGELCLEAGVKTVPTFVLLNGTQLKGVYSIEKLGEIMGC